jgi:hypothetical protein
MAESVWVFLPALLTAVAMAWMVLSELIPDAREESNGATVTTIVAFSAAAMVAFQFLIR